MKKKIKHVQFKNIPLCRFWNHSKQKFVTLFCYFTMCYWDETGGCFIGLRSASEPAAVISRSKRKTNQLHFLSFQRLAESLEPLYLVFWWVFLLFSFFLFFFFQFFLLYSLISFYVIYYYYCCCCHYYFFRLVEVSEQVLCQSVSSSQPTSRP